MNVKENLELIYLMQLLRIGAGEKYVKTSTTFLANVFGVSQQTASRILIRLNKKKLIERKIVGGVTCLKLTSKALEKLVNLKNELEEAFKRPGVFEFRGRVTTGFGEGVYYMKKRPYRKQIYKKLGFDPYPGTLNVRLEEEKYLALNRRLRSMKGIKIMGFENKFRTYGDVYAFRAVIEDDIEGAVIYAERTHYSVDIIELISQCYLREKLGLKNGDLINFRVFLSENV